MPWIAGALGLSLVLAAEVPRDKEVIRIDLIPGKMGAVSFKHAEHARNRRLPGGSAIRCRDCHHNLSADEPAPGAEMRCGPCHVGIGVAERSFGGKRARALAALKPDGAIDHRSVLFHDYCRNCHQKSTGRGRRLYGCKVCHERGVGPDVIHGRYDEGRGGAREARGVPGRGR